MLAGGAIIPVPSQLLRAVGDTTTRATVRSLAGALPFGAVVAGVLVAQANGFGVQGRTFFGVSASMRAVVVATIGTARWIAVRNAHR